MAPSFRGIPVITIERHGGTSSVHGGRKSLLTSGQAEEKKIKLRKLPRTQVWVQPNKVCQSTLPPSSGAWPYLLESHSLPVLKNMSGVGHFLIQTTTAATSRAEKAQRLSKLEADSSHSWKPAPRLCIRV